MSDILNIPSQEFALRIFQYMQDRFDSLAMEDLVGSFESYLEATPEERSEYRDALAGTDTVALEKNLMALEVDNYSFESSNEDILNGFLDLSQETTRQKAPNFRIFVLRRLKSEEDFYLSYQKAQGGPTP